YDSIIALNCNSAGKRKIFDAVHYKSGQFAISMSPKRSAGKFFEYALQNLGEFVFSERLHKFKIGFAVVRRRRNIFDARTKIPVEFDAAGFFICALFDAVVY
ncbi:MAG: hypothetical protein IKN27_05715, partial [Selenomonadaceae bacterium]|nr:hypothetical protein [Selenomonadaceae bacterium]